MICQASLGVAAARSIAGSVVSGGSGSMFGDEMFEEEENPCTVCLGELETGSTSKLDCGHIYHTEVNFYLISEMTYYLWSVNSVLHTVHL